jgi:hypothetical protein
MGIGATCNEPTPTSAFFLSSTNWFFFFLLPLPKHYENFPQKMQAKDK